ncbi:hypothetical protein PR202_gb07171 [Eleusine coracana subsp. coracana]|uniref:Uncharacterized protein n=1 Tax=Eleusine coracana subsp. coracana TaxID=191504 RepID=A0AAV5E902_ELECO|nr:hypothetical protein PR202_gb07171 [Eleusine coracana subsp. coracana]
MSSSGLPDAAGDQGPPPQLRRAVARLSDAGDCSVSPAAHKMHLTLSPGRTARKAAAAHARSASQPCGKRSHPALTRLDGALHALRSWSAVSGSTSSSSSLFEGLELVDAALAALCDLLATPRAAAALRGAGADDDRVLDAFLELADAYGTFGTALLAARQGAAEARAGVRRGDAAAVTASARAHRRTAKDLCRIAATMRHRHATAASSRPAAEEDADVDAEVVGVVAEVAEAAVEASGVIVLRCAAMSGIVQTVCSHNNKWLKRLGVVHEPTKASPEMAVAALERLDELEERISGLESASEKVFRRLLQTRVLLLNIHNPL